MAVYVDLSSEKLDPRAVARLVNDQEKRRASEDLLFKVSKRAHELVCARYRTGGVKVAAPELRQLNRSLKRSLTAGDFVIRSRNQCRNCGRTLTFYDLFESGRRRHGDSNVVRWFASDAYYVHLQKRGQTFPIKCTSCGTVNVLRKLMYDGPHY